MTSTLKQTFSPTISPELELLLLCARTTIDSQKIDKINALLKQNIDWNYLLQIADSHGVKALLSFNLSQIFTEKIPHNVSTGLERFFHFYKLHNISHAQELIRLLKLLEDEDIQAIPFKGPVLSILAYDNLTLRQFCDLDILVKEQDFSQAKALLIAQGYQQKNDREHEWLYSQAQLLQDDGRFEVDLHYEISPRAWKLDITSFWSRLEAVTLCNTTILTFSPEDSFLLLCVNGTKDKWCTLKSICDVAQFIESKPTLNWSTILHRSRILNLELKVAAAILLASKLLGITIPQPVKEIIDNDPLVKLYVWQILRTLFFVKKRENPFQTRFLSSLLQNKRSSSPITYVRDVIWQIFSSLFTPTEIDKKFIPLPPSLYFFYCLLRPIRLTTTYGTNWFKIFQNKLKHYP